MNLIKESKKVDLIIKSESWSDKELEEFRKIIKAQKAKSKWTSISITKHKTKHCV